MMSATIVFVLCALADPASCHEERPPIAVTAIECQMQGPAIAAEFLADRPKWRLQHWRCETGDRGRAS